MRPMKAFALANGLPRCWRSGIPLNRSSPLPIPATLLMQRAGLKKAAEHAVGERTIRKDTSNRFNNIDDELICALS